VVLVVDFVTQRQLPQVVVVRVAIVSFLLKH
jgi:hypothetical protein